MRPEWGEWVPHVDTSGCVTSTELAEMLGLQPHKLRERLVAFMVARGYKGQRRRYGRVTHVSDLPRATHWISLSDSEDDTQYLASPVFLYKGKVYIRTEAIKDIATHPYEDLNG